jgi:hypothetical protein
VGKYIQTVPRSRSLDRRCGEGLYPVAGHWTGGVAEDCSQEQVLGQEVWGRTVPRSRSLDRQCGGGLTPCIVRARSLAENAKRVACLPLVRTRKYRQKRDQRRHMSQSFVYLLDVEAFSSLKHFLHVMLEWEDNRIQM